VTSIAFDATALIHFARAGRLNELLATAADDDPVLLRRTRCLGKDDGLLVHGSLR